MIWTNIKSTRATAIIEALQKRNQHEIIAVPKLDCSDKDVNERQREKNNHHRSARFCGSANARDKQVDDQSADHGVNVRARSVCDRREKRADKDVSKKYC